MLDDWDEITRRWQRSVSAGKDGQADSTDSDHEFELSVFRRMDRREAAGKNPYADSSDEEAAA